MRNRLIVVTALFALLLVGAGCGAKKQPAPAPTPAPMDRNGPPNAAKPPEQPVNEPAKPTANDDGLDGALNDLSAAE